MSLRARNKVPAPRRGMARSKTNNFKTSWVELSILLQKIQTKDTLALSDKFYNIMCVRVKRKREYDSETLERARSRAKILSILQDLQSTVCSSHTSNVIESH